MLPDKINIEDYNYALPEGRIAAYPAKERSGSKLLISKPGQAIKDDGFPNIAKYLPKDCMLIMNNTKVIHARLYFRKKTGAQIEVFCLNPHIPTNYDEIFAAKDTCEWICMVGNAKKWKAEALELPLLDGSVLKAEKLRQSGSHFIIKFSWDSPKSFSEIIEEAGEIPVPPYLNRKTENIDKERYQTVYSRIKGSVAAPTAGLHFTPEILAELKHNQGIEPQYVTLHVGAGTFKPVDEENIINHKMHNELCIVPLSVIERLADKKNELVAVGTTTVRTLESLYFAGCQLSSGNLPDNNHVFKVDQWAPYKSADNIPVYTSLVSLIDYCKNNDLEEVKIDTSIIIVPGYKFRLVDALITNFHMPKSTLLLLIAAFIGEKWKDVYDYALEHDFRFLSYGDSSILFREDLV